MRSRPRRSYRHPHRFRGSRSYYRQNDFSGWQGVHGENDPRQSILDPFVQMAFKERRMRCSSGMPDGYQGTCRRSLARFDGGTSLHKVALRHGHIGWVSLVGFQYFVHLDVFSCFDGFYQSPSRSISASMAYQCPSSQPLARDLHAI